MKKIVFILMLFFIFSSCTRNQRARNWGGEETIKLNPQEKFINVSWKNDNLWIIVQDTTTGIYYAREKSSYGIVEGVITIK